MAKDLFLIRHAKSDWSFDLRDFDRPLNARGFRDAPIMAERLQIYYPKPIHLISSTAKRAITTAQLFAENRKISLADIQLAPEIYEATKDKLLELINNFPDAHQQIAVFGHNPGISDLINYLTSEGIMDVPTCAWAHIHFAHADHWSEISGGTGHLIKLATPQL
jgi:phosphohistidine phosphatase